MPIHCGRAIYGMEEVKEALSNAGAFLHQLPEKLERMNNQEIAESIRLHGLLLIHIKAMVSHLSEAEEFVVGCLEEEKKQ